MNVNFVQWYWSVHSEMGNVYCVRTGIHQVIAPYLVFGNKKIHSNDKPYIQQSYHDGF